MQGLLEPGTWNHVALQWTWNTGPGLTAKLWVNGYSEVTATDSDGVVPSFSSDTITYLGTNMSRLDVLYQA